MLSYLENFTGPTVTYYTVKDKLREIAMAFSGTYELESRENLDAFLTAAGIYNNNFYIKIIYFNCTVFIGATAEQKTAVNNMKPVQTITQNNDSFVIEKKLPKKVISNSFTLGTPCKMSTMQGKELEVCVVFLLLFCAILCLFFLYISEIVMFRLQ